MTDREALLRCVIESPQDDLPRLVMADWLEENGEPERAEFIRVQVELARPIGQEYVNVEEIRDLRRRERELLDATPFGMRDANRWAIQEGMPTDGELEWSWSRGFISSLTCDWKMFRRHASALIWHPEDKVECPALICRGCSKPILKDNGGVCDGCPCNSPRGINHGLVPVAVCTCHECQPPTEDGGGYSRGNGLNLHAGCVRCKGTGKVRRPFPPTAQPIETARLTTWPVPESVINFAAASDHFYATDGSVALFIRVKCSTCDGRATPIPGYTFRESICNQCRGTPPNRWTCDSWRGVVFEMPEARQPWQGFP